MRSAASTACDPRLLEAAAGERSALVLRLVDYVSLTKPRIALLALVTVCAGYALGSEDQWRPGPLLHALAGVALVAAGASALNQLFERRTDALMQRTASRPLPAGRLAPREVLWFGLICGAAGIVWLLAFVNVATAALAAATLLLYAVVYTPLKRATCFSTAIGAIPGALPPVLGWTAATGRVDAGAFSLFALLFLWQFPHFLAIAWIYRDDYARAGMKMLPGGGRLPRVAGLMATGYALALVPMSVYPATLGLAGSWYALLAALAGLGYVLASVRFALSESQRTARGLLWTSLVYLPLLLAALVGDHFRLLS